MKLTQASVLGLLGASSAAYAKSPRRPADEVGTTSKKPWPMYNTAFVDPTGTAELYTCTALTGLTATGVTGTGNTTNGCNRGLKSTKYFKEPYSCFRQGFFYFPTQGLTAGKLAVTGAADPGTYALDTVGTSNQSTTRMFWQSVRAQLGTLTSDENNLNKGWKSLGGASSALDAIKETSGAIVKTNNATASVDAKSTASYGKGADGNVWACCWSIYSQHDCNGGIDTRIDDGKSLLIANRMVLYQGSGVLENTANTGASGIIYGCDTAVGTAPSICGAQTNRAYSNTGMQAYTYNNDLLLASMFQSSATHATPAENGAKEGDGRALVAAERYCDFVYTEFAKEDSPSRTSVTKGSGTDDQTAAFSGHSKCTYQFAVAGGKGAPTLKFTHADYRDFVVHWMEWSGVAGDTTPNMLMLGTDASLFKMGVYTGTTTEPLGQIGETMFWNPLVSQAAAWPGSSSTATEQARKNDTYTTKWSQFKETVDYIPGSVGKVYWVPGKTGLQKNFQYTVMDSALIAEMKGIQESNNNHFNSEVGKYEPDRKDYNDKLAKETKRAGDFFAAGFEAPIKIPQRPCAPTRPQAYTGPQAADVTATINGNANELAVSTTNLSKIVAQTDGTYIELTQTTSLDTPAVVPKAMTAGNAAVWPWHMTMDGLIHDKADTFMNNRMGYMSASYDTDSSIKLETNGFAGRVYGRLGEGADTLPGSKAPFMWKTISDSDKACMQVSLFPQAVSAIMAADKKITIEVTPKTFGTISEYAAPGQPGPAAQPDTVAAAHLASASAVAAALALATLY